MAHIDVKQTYLVQFTSEEFRLVTLGLAGKLKDQEDVADALHLNTKLCEYKAKSLKDQHSVAYEAMCQAQLLENPSTPPTQKK